MFDRILGACAVCALLSGTASAETYTLQSTFGLNLPSIGQSPVIWADRVRLMTGGDVDIQVHGAGEFVPPFEVFGAVSSGALDMGFDWIGYWANQIPVANLVGSMPFGPSVDTLIGWMYRGGGMEIIQRAYDPYGVKIIPCHALPPEPAGWFRNEITSVDDFQGMNMRIAGLGGEVMARLGANAQMVPAGEIYVALETGRLDAAEFSHPALDVNFGFQEVAHYYYFPGWHTPSSFDSIIINMDVWNRFTPDQQELMSIACQANVTDRLAEQIDAQGEALVRIEADGGLIRRLPDSVLAALRTTTAEVLADEAARDPLFAEALASLQAYITRVGRWDELQSLPR